nr:MAG TPA: hypothetical protein [Caudoviricetes sp.]
MTSKKNKGLIISHAISPKLYKKGDKKVCCKSVISHVISPSLSVKRDLSY